MASTGNISSFHIKQQCFIIYNMNMYTFLFLQKLYAWECLKISNDLLTSRISEKKNVNWNCHFYCSFYSCLLQLQPSWPKCTQNPFHFKARRPNFLSILPVKFTQWISSMYLWPNSGDHSHLSMLWKISSSCVSWS